MQVRGLTSVKLVTSSTWLYLGVACVSWCKSGARRRQHRAQGWDHPGTTTLFGLRLSIVRADGQLRPLDPKLVERILF
jgi:hypothetical protein